VAFSIVLALLVLAAAVAVRPAGDEKVEERVNRLLAGLTPEEKLSLLAGTGFDTRPLTRLGLENLRMTDGPVGVRSGQATAFPASISLAASFDPSLVERVAQAIARETKGKNKNVLLGPCVNIHRVPHGGRNFESFGEDPYLAARMAVAYVAGVQSEGVVATVKHFAANNQEAERMTIDAQVDERALHEIYFPAFKAAVQEARVQAVMCSYNRLNGAYACENPHLLNEVLKRDWGFQGLLMSDWGATHSAARALNAGLDLEMPDGQFLNPQNLRKALAAGELSQAVVDEAVRRQLRLLVSLQDRPPKSGSGEVDSPAHRALNLEAARAGIVLLKNDRGVLPLERSKPRTVAVLGPNASVARTGGGGSALVHPTYAVSPLDALKVKLGSGVKILHSPGTVFHEDVQPVPSVCLRPPDGASGRQGLLGEYFDNPEFKGPPVFQRIDAQINFDWQSATPAENLKPDNFSVLWRGRIVAPETGRYVLGIRSDDGSRLYLDGKLLLDNWGDHAVVTLTTLVELGAGEPRDIKIEFYERGGEAVAVLGWRRVEVDPIELAVEQAKNADVALVFAGHTESIESEGLDRSSLELPAEQVRLIREVSKVNPRTVVVFNTGAPVLMGDWVEAVPSLLQTWFGGQEIGNAVADALLGDANPSGKLPMTFPKRWEHAPAYNNYPGKAGAVRYAEGIFVGYRHFDQKEIEPQFPFGFGLSYTSFGYRDLSIRAMGRGRFEVRLFVKNTGNRAGAEIVQLYMHDAASSLPRPPQELKGFQKVMLAPGEETQVRFVLDESSFSFYDPAKERWTAEAGEFEVRVGSSSRDIWVRGKLVL
jgi:beta-glucosidase